MQINMFTVCQGCTYNSLRQSGWGASLWNGDSLKMWQFHLQQVKVLLVIVKQQWQRSQCQAGCIFRLSLTQEVYK